MSTAREYQPPLQEELLEGVIARGGQVDEELFVTISENERDGVHTALTKVFTDLASLAVRSDLT